MSGEPLLGKARQAAFDAVSNLSDKLKSAVPAAFSPTGLSAIPGVVIRREARATCHILWPHEYTTRDLPESQRVREDVDESAEHLRKGCCGKDCASCGTCAHHPEQIDDADVFKMPVRFNVEERSKAVDAACCGPLRRAELLVTAPGSDAPVFTIERPQRGGPLHPSLSCAQFCGVYPCCGCLVSGQEMDVRDASGALVGSVLEVFTPGCTCLCCKRSEVEVRDADDRLVFLLRSDPLGLCYEPLGLKVPHAYNQAYGFEILKPFDPAPSPAESAERPVKGAATDALGDALVDGPASRRASKSGKQRARRTVVEFEETGCSILNMWAGAGSWRALPWSAVNNVKVHFPAKSSEAERALLLAAGFFLDYTYFSRVPTVPGFQGLLYMLSGRCGCCDHKQPDEPGTGRYFN